MARPDFRAAAARRLSEDRELSPAIVSLLSSGRADRARRRPRSSPSTASSRTPSSRGWPSTRRPSTSSRRRSASTASSSRSSSGRSAPTSYQLDRRRAPLARVASSPGSTTIPALDRGDRRRHGARDLDHREPPARGPVAARRSGDVRPDGPRARLQHPQARREARQGQGLPREPAPAGRRPGRDPRAGVLAQRHPLARLRADEGRRPEEAPAAGRAGRPRRADAGQAPRQDRGPAGARAAHGRDRSRSIAAPPTPPTGRGTDDEELGAPSRARRASSDGRAERRLAGQRQASLADAVEELVEVLRAGRRALDPRCRPGQPRQVPDDRQAPARERDRDRPDRREQD